MSRQSMIRARAVRLANLSSHPEDIITDDEVDYYMSEAEAQLSQEDAFECLYEDEYVEEDEDEDDEDEEDSSNG